MVLIDEDASGPGGTNQMAILALLQSPDVEVLGITTVTGDAWRDEAVRHTLRMLELTGHTRVPVFAGANAPLVRTQEESRLAAQLYGQVTWLGAWRRPLSTAMPEGEPDLRPAAEDAVHFLVRQVRAHPGQITIFAGGPLTNIALALAIEPRFAELTRGIVLMGGSLHPRTDDPEFATSPRHEFNFWFDPEAAHNVLRAAWPRIDVTTVDVSLQVPFTPQLLETIRRSSSPAARYVAAWSKPESYLWDELSACSLLQPSLITREQALYMDVDLSHGPSYGHTLTWSDELKPATGVRKVHAQLEVDTARFLRLLTSVLTR
ncbi:MAG: nucleoside hydrolase [Acidobacteria bacterium]|nr:nucleoside hydrolase [Acidobacteriota bacterium]